MVSRMGVGSGIGKIILMGEHAVVYGQPALAIPFKGVTTETTIRKTMGPIILNCFFYQGIIADAPKQLTGLIRIIKEIVHSFGEKLEGFNIDIRSSIPAERGMGSSAAVSIATIRSLYNYYNKILTPDDLSKWASISENIVHGNPSGIDIAVIMGETPLYYTRGQAVTPFRFKLRAYLVVGDTGLMGKTQLAVSSVKRLLKSQPQKTKGLIGELGELTRDGKELIKQGDIVGFGQAMSKSHIILRELGISNNALNNLISTALDNGALGAKLTGGGQGGCIIALVATREEADYICDKLINNGAKRTWLINMGVDL